MKKNHDEKNAVLTALRESINKVPEMFPGYRSYLLNTIAELITLEKNVRENNIPIQTRVNDKVDSLKKICEIELGKLSEVLDND